MKPIIQFEVSGKRFGRRLTHRVHILLAFTQRVEFAVIDQTFCRKPGSTTFQETSHLDTIPDVLERELPHDETAGRVRFK